MLPFFENRKVFKIHLENQKIEKENVNLARQINQPYAASRSLTWFHHEVTKHNNYALCFTSSTVKANSSFTSWNEHYAKSNILEKTKQP